MIARRFLVYFLIASGFAVAVTVVFEVYSLKRAADHAVEQHMLFARSVAQFVGGVVEDEARALGEVLQDPPDGLDRLRAWRRQAMDEAGVAVLDAQRRIVVADLDRGDLPPPDVLLPAMRHAEESGRPVVTDLWRGVDGRPRVALVVGAKKDGKYLAAVRPLRLDGEEFLRLFRFFVVNAKARLQLLDSRGVALYSTRPDERYGSVVHGTYFSDMVRLGEPVAMRCHSCHADGHNEPIRETEITTVAPVPGTTWSVSVREGIDDLFAPMREVAYSSVALVSVILGAFVGFFVLLSRRVLRPIRRLVGVASGIARGQEPGPILPDFDAQDEFATLAESLEAIRRRANDQATPREAADRALDTALEGLVSVPPITSVALVLDRPGGGLIAHGARLGDSGVLARVERSRRTVTMEELAAMGATVEGAPDTRSFHVVPIQGGVLWIGVSGAADAMGPYLAPVLDLIATHVQGLLVQGVLHDQLRLEHDQKNKMLRHLFEAEDEERRRIARELHDETAQVLSALLVVLETFPDVADPVGQAARLSRAKALVERLMDGTDRLMRRLRPAVLDDLGLVEAVRAAGQNILVEAGIEFDLGLDRADGVVIPRDVEGAVYRVFQEAMTNVLRHAGAQSVRARLDIRTVALSASIEDDGRGMDMSWVGDASARPRWGLLGMRERIVQIGGRIEFSAPSGGGVRIEFDVPLAEG